MKHYELGDGRDIMHAQCVGPPVRCADVMHKATCAIEIRGGRCSQADSVLLQPGAARAIGCRGVTVMSAVQSDSPDLVLATKAASQTYRIWQVPGMFPA